MEIQYEKKTMYEITERKGRTGEKSELIYLLTQAG